MENPEAIFDILSIRSMKERYYASSTKQNGGSFPPDSKTRSVFIPTPCSAIASDLAFLANQEALEHFVQDFAIDDSISDCFAETDAAVSLDFSRKAPSETELKFLTSPSLSKRVAQVSENLSKNQSISKESPTRPKVTFALQLSSREPKSSGKELEQSRHGPSNLENTINVNSQMRNVSASQPTQSRMWDKSTSGHAQTSQASAQDDRATLSECEEDELDERCSRQKHKSSEVEKVTENVEEEVEEKVTEKMSEKVPEKVTEKMPEKVTEKMPKKVTEKMPEKLTEKMTEMVPQKVAEKEKEKENSISKFPKFGLGWVIGNTIHRGKRNQTPNKKESRNEEKRRK
ncbi:hypothetical protein EGW08_017682, partial [Elysia chlorotica]